MKKSILFLAWFLTAFLVLSVSGAAPSRAEEEVDIMVLIETADTPEDHLKIAEYYEEQAIVMERKAGVYQSMAKAYEQRSKMPGLSYHSQQLAKEAKLSAEQYRAMAAEHRKMAQETQGQNSPAPQ